MSYRNENSQILSAKDVAYLITKRDRLGKLILSVRGTITALSDVIRAGSSKLFLIEVDKSVILVIKDFQLDWHSEMEPGSLMVFHGFRLTTLKKGVSKPCSILLILGTSSFTRLINENDMLPVPLQEWLKERNLDIAETYEPPGCEEAGCEEDRKLVNYEGTVTSAEMASSGIFILDNKIRLISVSDESVEHIKKHSNISVCNAHIVRDDHQLYLLCCVKSHIRIEESASSSGDTADSSTSPFDVQDPIDNKVKICIQKFIKKHGLNLKEIRSILQQRDMLSSQGRSRMEQAALFAYFINSHACAAVTKSSVNLMDCFIYHNQFCPFSQPQSHRCRIPQIVDLRSLREQAANSVTSLETANCSRRESSTHQYKLCSVNDKVLVGKIVTSPEGAVFTDIRGQLPVILLPKSSVIQPELPSQDNSSNGCLEPRSEKTDFDSDCQPHSCCQSCFVQVVPGACFVCPILESWAVGKMICVTRFHTVAENYRNVSVQSETDSGVCVYLAFSLLDCVLMDIPEKSSVSVALSSAETQPCSLSSSGSSDKIKLTRGLERVPDEAVCHIYVAEKHPLAFSGRVAKGSSQFRILGSKVIPDKENGNKCGIYPKRAKYAEVESSENPASQIQENSDSGKQDSSEKVLKPISATFSNTCSQWYPLIMPGHMYRFTSRHNSNSDPFSPKFSAAQLKGAAQRCNVRMNIDMPEDVLVERLSESVPESCQKVENVHAVHSISKILSASFSDMIVSFQGIIVSREPDHGFATADVALKGMRSQIMAGFKTEVREIVPSTDNSVACGSGITIYFDASVTVYNLGLIPGAVVTFHRVERKVSKSGNIYCRYTVISVAEVISLHHLCDIDSGHHQRSFTDLPRKLLINIWQSTAGDCPGESQKFRIHCHIERFFKLSVKVICSACKRTCVGGACLGRGCQHLTSLVPAANAVLLVEDGTCPATVKIWSLDVICRLLTLTDTQWEELIAVVSEHGEILIDHTSSSQLPAAEFLRRLTESALVLRPCRMVVKISKGSLLSHSLDKMRLEEFQEKDIKVGKHTLKTLALPRMQLECLAISETDSRTFMQMKKDQNMA